MQNQTKSRTSMYHLTIYWVESNLSFIQSQLCHILSMNVGSHGINQDITTTDSGILDHLHPQATAISPKPVKISQNQTEIGFLYISSPYLEEFSWLHPPVEGFLEIKPSPPQPLRNYLRPPREEVSCLHPPVEGFPEIKPPPPPTLGNFPNTTSPDSKTFVQSKAQP